MYFVLKIIIVCYFNELKKYFDFKWLNSVYDCKFYGIINYDKVEEKSKINLII